MVYLLLSLGANVDYAPGEITALHVATYYGHHQVVDLLLEHNANAKLKTGNNFMAFELAIQRGDQETSEKLMSAATFATDRCLMCFEELNENDKVVRLPCGHVYGHMSCLTENTDTRCPMCNAELGDVPLYELIVTEKFLAQAKK
jgi:ankyrin repeat protein